MSSKKEKRMESKKRKLEAMLNLMTKDEPEAKKLKESKVEVKDESSQEIGVVTSTSETLAEIRARMIERQKAAMQKSKLFLDPKFSELQMDAIYPLDVQRLLLHAIQGNFASYKPRWCKLIRPEKLSGVVFVVVESVSSDDVVRHPDIFRFLTENFQLSMKVISPSQYGETFARELFNVTVSTRQMTLQTDNKNECDFRISYEGLESINTNGINSSLETMKRSVSCLDLLLSEEQLKLEGYPIPLINSPLYEKYKFTKKSYCHPSETSPLFAVDCEMVRTKTNNMELAWIAVINEKLECVYQSLVKPRSTVIDYVTKYSGVTKKRLIKVTTTLADVQKKLQSILPSNAILVGQSLGGDLHSLEMFHPFIIDTSVIYNLSGIPCKKTGLKRLSAEFLGRDIQTGVGGHNPCEDAIATMELVLKKLKNGFEYGNVLNGWIYGVHGDDSKADDLADIKKEDETKDSSSEDHDGGKLVNSLSQRKFFFQQRRCQSLFAIAKRSEKSVAVVGFEGKHTEGAEVLGDANDSDKTVAKLTYRSKVDYFCIISQLKEFANKLQQSERCNNCLERSLQDVVKQVKRIVRHLPENNLIAVILSGRSDSKSTENGLCFAKIT